MKVRAAAVCLVAITFAIGAVRAHAQGPPTDPGAAASLAARIAALEARATALEATDAALTARVTALETINAALAARVTALETFDESDIVGNWKWQTLGIELNGGAAPGTPARVNTSVDNVVMTFNADHTVHFAGASGLRCTLPVLTFGIPGCQPGIDEPVPVVLTWSFANGVLAVLGSPDDGPLEFSVSASGIIVYADSSEFLPGNTWATIGVLVKMPN